MSLWFSEADVRAQLVEMGYPADIPEAVLRPFMRGACRAAAM